MTLVGLHGSLLAALLSLAAATLQKCSGEARFGPTHACDQPGMFKVCAKLLDRPDAADLQAWGTKDYFSWMHMSDPSPAVGMMQSMHGDHACVSLWAFGTVAQASGCGNVHLNCAASDVTSILSSYSDKGMDAVATCVRQLCAPNLNAQPNLRMQPAATPSPIVPPAAPAGPAAVLPQPKLSHLPLVSPQIGNAPSAVAQVSQTGAHIAGLPGLWFTSQHAGLNCNEVCSSRGPGWTFDVVSSQHGGNPAGRHFYPAKTNGGAWKSVECSSIDNNENWAADGTSPDGTWKNARCILNCACKQAPAAPPQTALAPLAPLAPAAPAGIVAAAGASAPPMANLGQPSMKIAGATEVAGAANPANPMMPKDAITAPARKRSNVVLAVFLNVLVACCCLACCAGIINQYIMKNPHEFNRLVDQHMHKLSPGMQRQAHNFRQEVNRQASTRPGMAGQPGYNQHGGQYDHVYPQQHAGGQYGEQGGYGGQQGLYEEQGGYGGHGQRGMELQGRHDYGQPGGSFPAQQGSFHAPGGSYPAQHAGMEQHRVAGSLSGGGYGPAPPPDSYQYQQAGHSPQHGHGQAAPFRHDAYRNPSAYE